MTELRFHITPGAIPIALLEKAYFASWGRLPKQTSVSIEGNEMVVRANANGSGTVQVLWPHAKLGLVMESTDSLLTRAEPYFLMKELDRGALGRLMRKLFEWKTIGFRCPENFHGQISEVSKRFSKAAVSNMTDPEIGKEFVLILEELDRLSMEASRLFTEQSIAWRMRGSEKMSVKFGIGMNTHPIDSLYEFDLYARFLKEAFHVVSPMPNWRDLEPEPDILALELLERRISIPARFGFQIILGPLINFDPLTLPTWLVPRLHEEGYLESRATRFVNTMAERFGSVADYWILANRFNSFPIKEVPTSRALTLIRLLAQQMQSRGIESPIMVGIDRPWGEYALQHVPDYDQIQIADSLMGCPEIDAFLLELHFGLDEHATLPRDPVAIGTMIDHWSFLGKKVYVSLSVPSNIGNDPFGLGKAIPPELQWSDQFQRQWTEILLSMFLGKRMVQGVFWTPLQDGDENPEDTRSIEPLTTPFSGLIDSSRSLKPAFKKFIDLRRDLLK